jgi:hypothetical protein
MVFKLCERFDSTRVGQFPRLSVTVSTNRQPILKAFVRQQYGVPYHPDHIPWVLNVTRLLRCRRPSLQARENHVHTAVALRPQRRLAFDCHLAERGFISPLSAMIMAGDVPSFHYMIQVGTGAHDNIPILVLSSYQ